MTTEIRPSLKDAFCKTGDIRVILDLIKKYDYSEKEVSEVINVYEPYEDGTIPEVEHIEALLVYFPKVKISDETMKAIKLSFPNRLIYINKLQKMAKNV